MNRKIKLSAFLLIGLFFLSIEAFPQDPNFQIYLAFGQSNMEGNAQIQESDKVDVNPRFQVMSAVDCVNLGRTKGKWYTAIPPLCRCETGLSPVDYFGRTMVDNLPNNIKVGVINVAVGGCKIELFDKDNYRTYIDTVSVEMMRIIEEYDGNPYGRLVEMAKLAQNDGVIKGILLHQGESNTNDPLWTKKVKDVYNNLIKDLNLNPNEVPLLAGELVNSNVGGDHARMNPIIATLPKTLQNSFVIPSQGCPSAPDKVHFTAEGYRMLGKRYALRMLSLLGHEVKESETLTVYTDQVTKKVSPGIYGQFLEHIYNSVHGGLWGDQILNGTLELTPPRRRWGPQAPPAEPVKVPAYWEFEGDSNIVFIDKKEPLNAEASVRLDGTVEGNAIIPGIKQGKIYLEKGEKYSLSLYARGNGDLNVTFLDGNNSVFSKKITGITSEWKKYLVDFTSSKTVDAATLKITVPSKSAINVDQVSLFSASALATGGYRPDLLKAVNDLKPASLRWPGGSFVSYYIWQNAIGPYEKRIPHPISQWDDRDTYHFGTDEFMKLCEIVYAEPIMVINTSRGVEDALNWLEYCMGDTTTTYGKQRAANGHPAPYELKTLEIDNETWRMTKSGYLDVIKDFCPAIRAKYPDLKLSVVGSYAYDTGVGESDQVNWDSTMIAEAGELFDILSPHYYNGLLVDGDYANDPYRYENFINDRREMIHSSQNPDMKIYVSEWNLTEDNWKNDWRVGLYAGGILNTFERQSDIITMTCPALFLRIQSARGWDNALINFDQKSWFPAGNYLVMKLWRDSFGPNLLKVDKQENLINFVASSSTDKQTVYLKVVNPNYISVDAAVKLDGDIIPKNATMQLIAPGSEFVKNTLEQPENIKVESASVNVENGIAKFTLPPLSAGVVSVMF